MSEATRQRLLQRLAHLPDAARRVEGYYEPVCAWIAGLARAPAPRPRTVFVSGPQGCGKSTLCALAVEALAADGLRAVAVSIDDFYLTHEAQRALAAAHRGNPFLEFRGYPGTHDVGLGERVIASLANDRGAGVRVPAYDKSAHDGRGDRAPASRWRVERGPFDVVLVEGWMLGFAPVAERALPDARMAPANAALAGYARWHALADALVHLAMGEPAYVVRWRVDAERARREAGAPGLSDEAARDYVTRFVPAYAAWVPGLRAAPPVRGPRLAVTLGEDRHPTAIAAR